MMLRGIITFAAAALLHGGAFQPVLAEELAHGSTLIEDFSMQQESRWRFITDQVMGGASTGSVVFAQEDEHAFARMTGRVSTANRGGFIQMRLDLATRPPNSTSGVRLIVRGNIERYFVHLRTGGTLLPWQHYQAGFDATEGWREIRLPFDAFTASGALLRGVPAPDSLTSVSIVANGRNHDALIDVREVGFY